ncbi:MAG: 50S ribosomal protein L29 [Candidatus Nanoperiomorbaceae bacterium]
MAEKKLTTRTAVAKKAATASVTAKTVKKDVAKTAKDLRALSENDLQKVLATAKADLLNVQKMLKANELPNTAVVRKSRKMVAKIHTILTEKINQGKEQK